MHSAELFDCETLYKYHYTHIIVYGILRLSETLNPVIYIFGSRALRASIMKICGKYALFSNSGYKSVTTSSTSGQRRSTQMETTTEKLSGKKILTLFF